ncbi:cytochrome P450 [Sphingomonas sp.]|uniref:cytochrome P450 n=1 Tax=Sphingomonas sp. TaxID=28214 RepID=UPI001EB7BE4A|nr:cytochrome P450 [Sphingomonas sp.]MBX3593408.1 cytochrome P450 [Sphingomonas sp.]
MGIRQATSVCSPSPSRCSISNHSPDLEGIMPMASEPKDLPRGVDLTCLSETFRNAPHAVLGAARERCPVYRDGMLRDYVVLSADIGRKVLSDRTLPTDPRNTLPTSTRRMRGEDLTQDPPIMFMDDPQHKRVRSLISKAFNIERIERFRPRVGAICRELIESIEGDAFDFIDVIARPLPTITIAEILGIDSSHHDDFKIWSDQMVASSLNPLAPPDVKQAGAAAAVSLYQLFASEMEARRAAGLVGDDLLTAMLAAEHDGQTLTDMEIIQNAQVLLIAGNQTTTDVLGTMLNNILGSGDSWARLSANPTLIAGAVDEGIRFDPPIFSTDRIAGEDMELNGVAIPKGTQISIMLPALNHDPALNPDPDRFDIERRPIKHFSFGGGRHTCLGAPLARMEAQELLKVMSEVMPGLHLDAVRPAIFSPSPGFRGIDQLWLKRS